MVVPRAASHGQRIRADDLAPDGAPTATSSAGGQRRRPSCKQKHHGRVSTCLPRAVLGPVYEVRYTAGKVREDTRIGNTLKRIGPRGAGEDLGSNLRARSSQI